MADYSCITLAHHSQNKSRFGINHINGVSQSRSRHINAPVDILMYCHPGEGGGGYFIKFSLKKGVIWIENQGEHLYKMLKIC